MTTSLARRSRLSQALVALAFGAVLSAPLVGYAGEIKFGSEPLAVDGEGKLTDAARKAAKDEITNTPGDEEWIVHLWAKLDKPAPGGLNVEFYGEVNGERYLAYRHVQERFDGAKYVSLELELEGSKGFNKNKTYAVEITQQDDKGRDFKLATGKLKLAWVAAAPSKDPASGETEGDKPPEEDSAAQDQLDTISGGEGGAEGAAEGGPPPVDNKGKKGCAVEPDAGVGALGLLVLFALGSASATRRRSD